MTGSAPVSCSLFAAPCEACAGGTEVGAEAEAEDGESGCEAAGEYDAGYEDVAVRGMEETSRSVPRKDAGSSSSRSSICLLFAPLPLVVVVVVLLLVGDAHSDGRYAVHDDHDDDDDVFGVRLLDVAALPTARACCSQTSRAL